MVRLNASNAWPNTLDLTVTITFLTLFLLLPTLGFVFMAMDIRRHLRSLKRGLAVMRRSFYEIPDWARDDTPRAIAALGLRAGCTAEELKRAYRKRVKKLHPDHGGDHRRFLLLQAHFEEALAIVGSSPNARRSRWPRRTSAA
jgi:hypothetical protein